MAVDRHGHPSISDIFGDETVLINIASETTTGTVSQRVKEWLAQNERNIYIGRGSIWGNPYSHEGYGEYQVSSREEAIEKYRQYLIPEGDALSLRGKRLGCWCRPKSCHGDVLLERIWTHGSN